MGENDVVDMYLSFSFFVVLEAALILLTGEACKIFTERLIY